MGQENSINDCTDALPTVTRGWRTGICPSTRIPPENNFLLNKLGWLPQGGLVQQTFICHAAHSR